MNPVLTIIASALGGAVVTGIIGIVTFVWTGKRDHARWLYDLKYQSYLEVLRVWKNWSDMLKPVMSAEEYTQMDAVHLKIRELVAADLVLVNSSKVDAAFTSLLSAMTDQFLEVREGDREEIDLHLDWLALVNTMREDLRIAGHVTSGDVRATRRAPMGRFGAWTWKRSGS